MEWFSEHQEWSIAIGTAALGILSLGLYKLRVKAPTKVTEATKVAAPASAPAPTPAKEEHSAAELSPAPAPKPIPQVPIAAPKNPVWEGLSRTRAHLKEQLLHLFSHSPKLDNELLEALHERLYRADLGVKTADLLIQKLKSQHAEAEWTLTKATEALSQEISALIDVPAEAISAPTDGPLVILVVGVNGAGKTTTIGKLGAHFAGQGKKVMLAAADTFRAAAIEQLGVWAERTGADLIKHQAGSDPAAVAYDAVKAAKARGTDILLIDTAGRLHNKKELMDELGKIKRIIARDFPSAPQETWLVVDSTSGQNALIQAKTFGELIKLTGLIVTKLDGTAKGGVLVAAAHDYQLPIRFIGVGEKTEDLRPFDAKEFAASLF